MLMVVDPPRGRPRRITPDYPYTTVLFFRGILRYHTPPAPKRGRAGARGH